MGMCIASSAYPGVGNFFKRFEVAIIGLFVLIVCVCTLAASKSARMTVPTNYFLLLLMTLAEAASVCAMTADLDTVGVLISCGVFSLTLLCLFGSSLFVKDKNSLRLGLVMGTGLAGLITLFCLPFLLMNFYGKGYEWAWIITASLGCVLAGIYVMVDLLDIMDIGLIAQDEYIMASFILYIDCVRLLIYMLILFSKNK